MTIAVIRPASGETTYARGQAVIRVGEKTAEAARQAARAEAAADDAIEAVSSVAREGTNLLDPDAAGWATDKRINTANGNADNVTGWDSTPFILLPAGTYWTNLTGFLARYNASTQAYIEAVDFTAKPFFTLSEPSYVRGSAQRLGNTWARDKIAIVAGSDYPQSLDAFGTFLNEQRLASVPATAFEPNTITPEVLATYERGGDLLDRANVVDGFYVRDNGGIIANASYSYWPAIPVEAGDTFNSSHNIEFVTFIDAAGLAQIDEALQDQTSFTAPDGAVEVFISTLTALKNVINVTRNGAASEFNVPRRYRERLTIPSGERIVRAGGDPDHFGLDRLRETRQRLRKLRYGVSGLGTITGTTARLTVAMIGDSWVHDSGRIARPTARTLWKRYHDGANEMDRGPIGMGWISFKGSGSGSSPNGTIWNNNILTGTGTWTSENGTSYSPDTGSESSNTVGATLTGNAIDFDYDLGCAYDLYADGGAGVVRYRWTAAGSWVTADLSALSAGLKVISMTGMPASGTGRFTLEVVSGSPKVFGMVERHPTNRGVLVHKLGATGTRMSQWAALDATQWQAGISALAPDLVTILHGTNDQSAGRTKTQFKADAITLIDRIRTARPSADVLLIAPAENQRTSNPIPMSEYQAALYEIAAKDRDVAFLNLQAAFGKNAADYANGSSRPWFASDLIHPDPATGGYAMTDALLRAIGEASA